MMNPSFKTMAPLAAQHNKNTIVQNCCLRITDYYNVNVLE